MLDDKVRRRIRFRSFSSVASFTLRLCRHCLHLARMVAARIHADTIEERNVVFIYRHTHYRIEGAGCSSEVLTDLTLRI